MLIHILKVKISRRITWPRDKRRLRDEQQAHLMRPIFLRCLAPLPVECLRHVRVYFGGLQVWTQFDYCGCL